MAPILELPVDEALRALRTNAGGLTAAEAAARLESVGPNVLESPRKAWPKVLAAQLRNPLLALLIVAAALSIALGERVDGAIIVGIMLLSVGLGFFNEYRSEQTLAALRERTGRRATVLRDGRPYEVPASDLVPGDVCLLQIGDVVPADMRLLSVAELSVDESTLTGEAFPVEKRVDAPQDAAGSTFETVAYAGTVVRSGSGRAAVCATGRRTRLGSVAGGLSEQQPPTAFQRGLGSFTGLLARVTGLLTVFIFVMNAALGKPFLDAFLFSLAIAVGLTPQLLPAIVTVSLATGARRMARRSVLVKRLVSIEDLGDADVVLTDKTGTLTQGNIVLFEAIGPDGKPADGLAELGLVCSQLDVSSGTPLGNTLDLALWHAFEPAVARAHVEAHPRLATLPFTFERRRTSVVIADGTQRLLCKGASEEVLARCTTARVDGRSAPISSARKSVDRTLRRTLDAGHRTLAVAARPIEARDAYTADDETGLELLGFLVFTDPPKDDAAESVARLRRLGIELKVVTGDHEQTAAYVCSEVGLPVKGIARGSDLEGMSDEELDRLVVGTTVFARVSPEQKAVIVRAVQRSGSDVAFIGDGVNDALALRAADVGVSVESAVDVAREAADVVLLEKDLGVLADGVAEGRRIFANTMKYVLMGTSSNFGNMFSAAGASLFLSFLPMLPSQILLNNLLYDVSEMTIPTDRVDEELLERPEHWDVGFIRRFMLFFGPISSVYDFATFAVMLWVFHAGAPLFRSGWFVESLATQALVVFVIRTRRSPFFRSRPSRPLVAATFLVVGVAAALPFSPLASTLGFRSLPLGFLAILAGMVVTYLALAETGKHFFYRHVQRPPSRDGRVAGSTAPTALPQR